MKTFTLIAILAATIILDSCASKNNFIPYQRTGEVEYIEQPNAGTMTIKSNAFASNGNDAVFYAEKNAIENIFFKGIPGSPQATPMISDRNAAFDYKDFFNNFFDSGEYRKYIIKSIPIYQHKTRSGFSITQEITVDINALRKYLEENKIIRRFGF